MQGAAIRSSLDVLAGIPDPRGRHGRRYPMQSLLAALILAAMNGQASLRGMWLWARVHSDRLTRHLPFPRNRIPALETFRTLLCRLDLPLLLEAFNGWLMAIHAERVSLDEKVLRGSKRDCEAPLLVVAAFGHKVGLVLSQIVAEGQDKTEAPIALLARMPLDGKLFYPGCRASRKFRRPIQAARRRRGAARGSPGRSCHRAVARGPR